MRNLTEFLKWLACKAFYKVEYHNLEMLDKYNTYLICPSHSCVFDPAFVFPGKYDNDIYIMAKQELFKHASFRWLSKKYNIFSIDRENVDVKSLLKSIDIFKKDEKAKLIMFPEGKVVKDENEIGKVYKKGAAFLALHMEKPIIPVFITRRPKFFSKVHVIFGEPYLISEQGTKNLDEISKVLIEKIYSLKEEENK